MARFLAGFLAEPCPSGMALEILRAPGNKSDHRQVYGSRESVSHGNPLAFARLEQGDAAMDEAEQVSELIGDVYDAALDPASWPKALEKTCGYVEGVASILLSQDSAQKSADVHVSWGDDPEYARSYQETYVNVNPLLL